MPTYEYECRSCHHRFERSQSITARSAAACPKCKKGSKRLISIGGGALFKGSGFYTTDYRSSGYKKAAAGEANKAKEAKETGKAKEAGKVKEANKAREGLPSHG